MATATPTITDIAVGNNMVKKAVWQLTSTNVDGAPIGPNLAEFADRTVYLTGTWGAATAVIQGGDGTIWLSLTDPQGNAISKTADAIEVVTEAPEFMRPSLSTAGSGAEITVTMIMRRGFRRSA